MTSSADIRNQSGFSLLEMMVTLTVMLVVMGSVMSLFRDSLKMSITATELSEAQESLRTAQEYINRDLLTAGDGLKDITNVCVPVGFVSNYLTKNPNNNPCGNGLVNLPLMQSDDNVPAGTTVLKTVPAVTVRSNPSLTDRMTMLQQDQTFTPVNVAANGITVSGLNVKVPAADVGRFAVGDIYFFSSSAGATFGTVTAINAGTQTVSFGAGDSFGLNNPVANGPLDFVSGKGLLPTSIMRMRIVHYFVNQSGLLIKRVFGVAGGVGSTDTVVAERVRNLQVRYIITPATAGAAIQPVTQLVTPAQQLAVNQVEVTLTTETVRPVNNGKNQPITMTTTTSLRNIQFIEAQKKF